MLQAHRTGATGYLSEFWNYVDVIHITLTLATAGTYFAGWTHARAVLAVAVYLRWFGYLHYLEPFHSTGPLVRMILQICFDMRHFLLVLSIAVVAGYTSFNALLRDQPLDASLGDPAHGLLTVFNMFILADFELDLLSGRYEALLRIIFLLSMVLVPIVLLNLLIALMSDSYERIQVRCTTHRRTSRLGLDPAAC